MRHEIKYLVPIELADGIRRTVRHVCKHDKYSAIMPEHAYTVRSIYYDTCHGAIYDNKVEGLNERVKVRIRGYNEVTPDSSVGLELKRKRGALSWKSRARTNLTQCRDWLAGCDVPYPFDAKYEGAARRFGWFVHRFALRPANLVTYEREAYEGLFDPTLRVTLDMNLRGLLTDDLMDLGAVSPIHVFDSHFILEVKFDYHFPTWIKPFLAEHGIVKKALSKYTMTIDACTRAERRSARKAFKGRLAHRRGPIFNTPRPEQVTGTVGLAQPGPLPGSLSIPSS